MTLNTTNLTFLLKTSALSLYSQNKGQSFADYQKGGLKKQKPATSLLSVKMNKFLKVSLTSPKITKNLLFRAFLHCSTCGSHLFVLVIEL